MPPIEIIDLLSSPDVAPPRAAPRPKPPPPPTKALDYDMLDLTVGDTGRRPRPRLRAAPAKRPSKSPPKSSSRDFSFVADDDDDDDDDAPRLAKKPRTAPAPLLRTAPNATTSTSTRPVHRTVPSGPEGSAASSTFTFAKTGVVGWGAPGVLLPTALKPWNTTVDPIQTSSDPFASSPRQAAGKQNSIIDLSLNNDDGDDFDPFASSPIQPSKGKGKTRLSVSPLAERRRRHVSGSPTFVSCQAPSNMASPVKKAAAQGKGRKAVAWDHISSSAPEAGPQSDGWDIYVQPARNTLGRSRSDGARKDFDLGDPDTFEFDTDDDDDLPELSGIRPAKSKSTVAKSISKVTKQSTTSKSRSSKKTLAEKESDKIEKAMAKEIEKARKQREKDVAKEQRRLQKERAAALAEVNKVKTDKRVSTPDMIVDLPTSLNPSLKLQVEFLLEELKVEFHSQSTPVKNVVTWRRKVQARLNEDEGHWEPIPARIEKESHAMVIVPAAEFVELALGAKGSDLEAHVLQMQRHYDGHTLIYLIEGLTPFMRKNTNARNRQFEAAVLARAAAATTNPDATPPPSTQQQQRKRNPPKPPAPHIDQGLIEDALLSLQVHHNALIHHTAAPVETAEWVKVFTQHISTIPHRRQKEAALASAAFCMDSGQVRTGDGARDTYVRMLQEIARVTTPMAHEIAAEFVSVGALVRAFEERGALALEEIRKSANRDGAFTDRTLGQAMSRRVCKVFMGRDENSTAI